MANPIHLWLQKGTEPGTEKTIGIEGKCPVEGRQGSIEIIAQDHSVELPTDEHTGKSTGTRIHKPFRFTKEIDATTPYLYKAVSNGETIGIAQFDFYQTEEGSGQETLFYKTTLKNVKIVKVASKMHDIKDPAKAHYRHMEEVELRYEDITWEIVDGAVKHTDKWTVRSASA